MGLAKRKTIKIYSKKFKTILAFNTPVVIPWGQMDTRTDERINISSIFRDKLLLQGSLYTVFFFEQNTKIVLRQFTFSNINKLVNLSNSL
jgi:hypothetical protein